MHAAALQNVNGPTQVPNKVPVSRINNPNSQRLLDSYLLICMIHYNTVLNKGIPNSQPSQFITYYLLMIDGMAMS